MKNLKFYGFLMMILAVVLLPTSVFALENEVNVDSETALTTCFATSGNTCKLTGNIVTNNIVEVNPDVTIILDLNGHSITPSSTLVYSGGIVIIHNGGQLTINDSVGTGLISSGTTGNLYAAVQVTKKGDSSVSTATLIVNAGTIEGYYYGITGNGSRPNTSITINGGTIKGNDVEDNMAIFHPQTGALTINGGTITGLTGIEMRAGTLNVNGGTITGNANYLNCKSNKSGSTTVGAGIAVVQHTTKLDVSAYINGGTIKGYMPLYQKNIENNDETALAKVTLEVKGGSFIGTSTTKDPIYSENKTSFVNGGTFSNELDAKYIKSGYAVVAVNSSYKVGKINTITTGTFTNGTVTSSLANAISGQSVNLTVTPSKGYELATLKVLDNSNNEITVTNNSFIMPNANVTITATFTKTVIESDIPVVDSKTEVTEVTVGVKDETKTTNVLDESLKNDETLSKSLDTTSVVVEVEITPIEEDEVDAAIVKDLKSKAGNATISTFFDINVLVKNANTDATLGSLKNLSDKIELLVLLPESLKNSDKSINRKYYIVREHDGKTELLEAKLSDDGNYLIFETDKFSTYALAYVDTKVSEKNPKTIDNVSSYYLLASISLIGLLGTSLVLKKEN